MTNAFWKSIHSLRRSVGRVIQNLSSSINEETKSGSVAPKVGGSTEQHQIIYSQPAIEQKAAFRISAHEKGIWAACSSCGTVHLLEAVCYSCGKPLCRDPHCRATKYHTQLKRMVVSCNECKNNL